MCAYVAENTATAQEEFRSVCKNPMKLHEASPFLPMPNSNVGKALELNQVRLANTAASVLNWVDHVGVRKQNMTKAIDTAFESMHKVIPTNTDKDVQLLLGAEEDDSISSDDAESPCWQQRVCVCLLTDGKDWEETAYQIHGISEARLPARH